MIINVPLYALPGAAVALLACALSTAATAQDASPWQQGSHATVRLLAGSRSGTVLLGGIAFQLEPGWKTFWRTPGDSGVPPHFDFSRSDNVDAVTVLWPAPSKFPDGAGGHSLGYKEQVVLPLRIVATNADKPITLRATVGFAVCAKLCIPAEVSMELAFASVASAEDSALAAALDRVPKPARLGDPNPLTIRDVRREGTSTVVVDVETSNPGADVNLFVEGPTPDWALPIPAPHKHAPHGLKRFSFKLDGMPENTSAEGAELKLTLVGDKGSYEFNINLN